MTNSTPKMINKIERQGSPNNASGGGGGGGKRQNQRNNNNNNNNNNSNSNNNNNNNTIKTSTYFPSVNRQSRNTNGGISGGRNSCSPPCQSKIRGSPLRQSQSESPRGSPTNSFYAGAKFSEPPSPASLPKPPSHWTTRLISSCKQQSDHCRDISNHLKMILNVQA